MAEVEVLQVAEGADLLGQGLQCAVTAVEPDQRRREGGEVGRELLESRGVVAEDLTNAPLELVEVGGEGRGAGAAKEELDDCWLVESLIDSFVEDGLAVLLSIRKYRL